MRNLLKTTVSVAALATIGLWTSATIAADCPTVAGTGDTVYMTLSLSVGSATCQASEATPPVNFTGSLENWIATTYNTGPLGAKSDGTNASFFNYITGTGTSGTSGSFTTDDDDVQYLLFKTGDGQNDPSWFLFRITGATLATVYSWEILARTGYTGSVNGLSHISAFVPIPAAAWLMGSGLIALFGIARRRKVAVAAA